MKFILYTSIIILLSILNVEGQNNHTVNIAKNKPVYSSSETKKYPASKAVDGTITRDSKWMTNPATLPPHFLEIDLQKYFQIDSVVIHTGIPEKDRTPAETGQAAGFWAVKHFRLQYWDDANWTDIPSTEITENRQTAAGFQFSPPILTFKMRLVAYDGEPLNVMEIEIFGEEVSTMVVPELSASTEISGVSGIAKNRLMETSITIKSEVVGKSMEYVAYNQAYYLPGSNTSGWLEYSEVNSLRVWTTLSTYVPVSTVQFDPEIANLQEFDKRKAELRKNPETNSFINWKELQKIYSEIDFSGTNSMLYDYVLEETKRLGIEVLLQINERRFPDEWHLKWQQWQRFYALAYHSAKEGNVSMFAIQNEPNHRHSGPMSIEEWLRGMQIASDAVRCAVEDVNLKYGKNLVPKFVGPVTAGTNIDWWAEVIKNVRTDYRGKKTDYDLIDIFSTHSYNSPAAGYANRVENIRKLIRENHPEGKELPVVFTEIGRWMNAYLIDKEETMDSPSLFTEWAGIYTNNMLNGGYGMWAFKFASNVSSTYPSGIKSGHHFTWNGRRLIEDSWKNLAFQKPVNSSISSGKYKPENITDGITDDYSCFVFNPEVTEKWLEIDLLKSEKIGSSLIYTGSSYGIFTGPDRVKNFKLQYKNGHEWTDIPGASVSDWKYVQVLLEFDEPVHSRYFRMVALDEDTVKVREIKLFGFGQGPETAEESYDISGIHRTGEVVRLFAKGFKEQRNLYRTEISEEHPGLDACTSYDAESGNHYIWLVQRSPFKYKFKIDVSALQIPEGTPVIAEAAGPHHYGEVAEITQIQNKGIFEIDLPGQTVMLITIPAGDKMNKKTIKPASAYTVSGKTNSSSINEESLKIALDASDLENNKVTYVHFNLSEHLNINNSQLSLLEVSGFVDKGEKPMRIHVYGFPSSGKENKNISWGNAPNLDTREALVKNVGKDVFFVGQIAFDREQRTHYLDVTRHLKKYPDGIAFILIREIRHMGDYGDKGRNVVMSSAHSEKSPVLIDYYKSN